MTRLSAHGTSCRVRLVLGLALALLLVTTATAVVLMGVQERTTPPSPGDSSEQPIAFSHRVHVNDVELNCQLCHVYARRSPVAGIPSVERCAGCHRVVLPDRPEIQKVLRYWEDEEPIPWVRVHDLPDHVRFTHKRHVRAGVACQECHGDVAQMEIAQQVVPLTMGWCVTCHQERHAPLDCLTCHY